MAEVTIYCGLERIPGERAHIRNAGGLAMLIAGTAAADRGDAAERAYWFKAAGRKTGWNTPADSAAAAIALWFAAPGACSISHAIAFWHMRELELALKPLDDYHDE